ncbi:MAG: FIST N-terminal domain-containing protein [Anaerolineales bacterium]|nr:MAG: FIST N-terminal domain-containing protein [Anaerolineales bacterium]
MTLKVAVGQAHALSGREAGLQATHQALNRLGPITPGFGLVIASHQYAARDIVSGVSGLLGDTPLIGFSSPAGLTSEGVHPNSVVVVLFAGDLQAETHWLPGYAQSGRETAAKILRTASEHKDNRALLFFADGFNGDADQLCNTLADLGLPLTGALSAGDLDTGHSYQLAGPQTGTGALTAAFLRGDFNIGIGAAHGWNPVGSQFRITRSRGFWLRTLDGRPASESYAQLFGYPARDWAFPPLSHLARLYPLGVEQGDQLVIRAPIRVEADGSFRLNAPVHDGVDAYLLVGSRVSCEQAAQSAAQQAVKALDGAKPVFALTFVDLAWEMLLKSHPGAEIAAMREILGPDVPIAGGYSLGQIVPGKNSSTPQLLNQHIVVVAFGESVEQ